MATKPAGKHAGKLKRGVNILPGSSASFTEKGRYSDIKVRGQATEGSDKQQFRGQSSAKDNGISRKRTLILRHEGEASTGRMKNVPHGTRGGRQATVLPRRLLSAAGAMRQASSGSQTTLSALTMTGLASTAG